MIYNLWQNIINSYQLWKKRKNEIKNYREPRLFPLSEEEIKQHNEFLAQKIKNALWTN